MSSPSLSKEKFTIIIRLRPDLKEDYKLYKPSDISSTLSASQSRVTIQRKNNQQKTFKFNWVLDPGKQQDVYQKSQHLVDSLFQGYNATFLAYGQTGTGKTHTVFGSDGIEAESGYFYSSVKDIFSRIKQRMHMRQFAVRVSFVEFYLDNIFDLISNDSKKLELKQNGQNGIYIKDLTEVPVKSQEELFACVKQAIKSRKTQQTSINKRSSRSHAVIQIVLLQRWIQNGQTKYIRAMLRIVDLAGSQRVSKTQSNGSRLEQAKRINKQITTLGKCINMLAVSQKQGKLVNNYDITNKFNFNKTYIPFRDAKITRFLSDSLQGKAKITLCVCVSKHSMNSEETFSSLLFASQASTLKIDSKRNDVYTLTPSIDKAQFQTPSKKSKPEMRKSITPVKSTFEYMKGSQTFFSQNSIRQSEIFEQSQKMSQQQVARQREQLKQGLMKRFCGQLKEINDYLRVKEIKKVEEMSPNVMMENICQMNSTQLINSEIFQHFRSFTSSAAYQYAE